MHVCDYPNICNAILNEKQCKIVYFIIMLDPKHKHKFLDKSSDKTHLHLYIQEKQTSIINNNYKKKKKQKKGGKD